MGMPKPNTKVSDLKCRGCGKGAKDCACELCKDCGRNENKCKCVAKEG